MNQSSAAEKIELRDLAKDNLLAYCCLVNPAYEIPNHISTIAHILERVERGELKRVIVTIPPRHGKSMLCSQYFPAWYLGRNPDKYLITATYGQELSDDFGRRVRDQVEDPAFQAVFPDSHLRRDTRAANRMETDAGGIYVGVGVGGPITGRGAHVLLIDDPVKNREEADSSTALQKVIDWYRSVAYTRLMPGGAIVIIMTRWSDGDLAGYLISENAHENWVKVDLPALNEETNEVLWPERYSFEDLQRIRATIREYDWACMYQQNPIPKEGIIFKPEWLLSGLADEYAAKFIGVDPAISKKDVADETAICVMGLPYGEKPTFDEIETAYGRWSFHEQIQMIKVLYEKHRVAPNPVKNLEPDMPAIVRIPCRVGVEAVAYQKALGQELRRLGVPAFELPADVDKVRRAVSVSHYFAQGRVRINTPALRNQLLAFRGAEEKNDLADACFHTVRLIISTSSMNYERPTEPRLRTYDERVQTFMKRRRARFAKIQSGEWDPQLGRHW